jgi:hypothetical protein
MHIDQKEQEHESALKLTEPMNRAENTQTNASHQE